MHKGVEYWYKVLESQGEIIMSPQEANNPSLFVLDQLQTMGCMIPHESPEVEGFQYVSDKDLRPDVAIAYRYSKGLDLLYSNVINNDHSFFADGLVISISLNIEQQEKKIERLLKPVYERLKEAV